MRATLAGLALLAAAAGGCGDSGGAEPGDRPRVVATTPVVADIVRRVGGDRVEVVAILRPNADPHLYEPRPSDVQAVVDSDLIVRSGGDLDEWLDGIAESAGSEAPVLDLRRRLAPADDDPHWWHDLALGARAARLVGSALAAADRPEATAYTTAARRYAARLTRLDATIAACMRAIPSQQRKLVTTHDALGHFARRYDVEMLGSAIPALSTSAQPSAGETAALVRRIRTAKVKAVFPESSVGERLERAIADEAGAVVGGTLWADTLGPRGSSGASYAGAIAWNADTIARGLTGRERPLSRLNRPWLEHAIESVAASGRRSSSARGAVIELLAGERCALSAREIVERLGARRPRVGQASVYRALELLVELRLIARVDTASAGGALYEPLAPDGEHHHHAICDRCGRVEPVADEPLERAIAGLTARLDFSVEAHDVVLRGRCAACA